MKNAATAIAAVRDRLEGAGHRVHLFRTIDVEFDKVPCVGVYFHRDGEQSDLQEVTLERSELLLDVLLLTYGDGDDPEIQAVKAGVALKDTLVRLRPDKIDDLDGGCQQVEIVSMNIDTRHKQTDALAVWVTLRAHYSRT